MDVLYNFKENSIALADYYLQNLDAEVAYLFLQMNDISSQKEFLSLLYRNEKLLCKCSEEAKMQLYWRINAFRAKLNENDEKIKNSFIFYLLQKINPQFYAITYSTFANPVIKVLRGKNLANAFNFLNYLSEKPSLLHAIQPFISNLVHSLPLDQLFGHFSFAAIDFFSLPPLEFLAKEKYVVKSFKSCFEFPVNYSIPNTAQILQYRFSNLFSYPQEFPEVEKGILSSLIHSSIIKKTHFVDLMISCAKQLIVVEHNSSKAFSIAKCEDEFFAWMCCSFIKKVVNNVSCLENLVYILKNNGYDSIAFEAINRLYSDIKLLAYASERSKRRLTSSDLIKYSIPKLLNTFELTNEFREITRNDFFIISDETRDKDVDFVRSYTIISLLIRTMQNTILDPTNYAEIVKQIAEQMHLIKDKKVLHDLIIDIYSVLFIKKENVFICSLYLAKLVVNLLVQFEDIKELNEMKIALNCASLKGGVFSISRALYGRKTLFFNELGSYFHASAEFIGKDDPYLYKIYRISKAVISIINSEYKEEEDIKKEVSVESAFSLPYDEERLNVVRQMETTEEIKEIAEKRQKDPLTLFQKLDEQLPMIRQFDEGQEFEKIQLPANVSSFIQLIEILRQCESIDTPIQELFIELASKGNITEIAAHLKNYGFEVFGFWLEHQDLVTIDEHIIEAFIHDNTCECLSLIMEGKCEMPSSINPSSFGAVIEHFFEEKNASKASNYKDFLAKEEYEAAINATTDLADDELSDALLDILLHGLQSHKFAGMLLDDIMFRIDTNKLQECCSSEYESFRIRLANRLIEFIEFPPKALLYITTFMCSSVGPYENPKIGDYMQGTNFNICLNVVYNKVPFKRLLTMLEEQEVCDNMKFICKNVIKTPDDLNTLLLKYPKFISQAFSVLKTENEFHKVFVRNCPIKYRSAFNSLMSLPDLILKGQEFDFSDEAISAAIRKLLVGYHGIDMMKPLLARYNNFCERFPESKPLFDETIKELMKREISQIKVASSYQENMAKKLLGIFLKFHLPNEDIEKLQSIKEMLSIGLFQRFNVSYTFEDYPNESCTRMLSEILFKNEFDSEGIQFCEMFNLSFKEVANQRLKICFSLGILDHARFWAPYADIDTVLLSGLAKALTPTDALVSRILSQEEGKIENISFNYLRAVKELCNKKPKPSAERIDVLQNFVSFFVHPQNKVINFLCSNKFYDMALKVLCIMHQTDDFIPCFINDFVFPTISYGKINELTASLFKFDSGISFILPLLVGLTDFFKEKQMHKSLLNFLIEINWLEDAAVAAIEIFNETQNFAKKLIMIYHAADLFNQSSNIREGRFECSTDTFPFRPSILNEKQLKHMQDCVQLHTELFEFSKQANSEKYSKAVSTVINDESAHSVALELAFLSNFRLLRKVTDLFAINSSEIITEVAKIITPKSFDEIKKYLGSAKRQTNDFITVVFHPFINALTRTQSNWCLIPALIGMFIDDPSIQCSYFLEYNFLSEAVEITTRKKLKQWMPLIGIKASQLGNTSIVDYIQKKEKM